MEARAENWKVVNVIETLLLVDGEAAARNLAKFMLEVNGYRVVEAADGVEALMLLDQYGEHIHLALCSAELPDMTGPEWRAQVRFLAPELPVLVFAERDWVEASGLALRAASMTSRDPGPGRAPGRIMEKVRYSLDERFFSGCRAPAA